MNQILRYSSNHKKCDSNNDECTSFHEIIQEVNFLQLHIFYICMRQAHLLFDVSAYIRLHINCMRDRRQMYYKWFLNLGL